MLSRVCRPLALAFSLSCAIASVASAQATEAPLPFHAGQWTAYGMFAGSSSVGLMRFSTARRAFTIDANARISSGTSDQGTFGDVTNDSWELSTRLGVRRYRGVAQDVVSFVGIGPRLSVGHGSNEFTTNQSSSATGFGVGAFVDLGVAASVHKHLLVGVTGGVDGGYARSRATSHNGIPPATETKSTSHSWGISAGLLRLEATVLF